MNTGTDKRFAREKLEVSRAYRQLEPAMPPPELDERIARHARAVLPRPDRSWRAPRRIGWLALAASVLLSTMTLVLINLRSTPRNVEPSVRMIHAVATREDRAQLRYPAPPAFVTRRPGETLPYVAPLIPPRRLYSTDPPGSHRESVAPSAPEPDLRRDPQRWAAHIELLDREGRTGEAAAERREFRQAYPDLH